MAYVNWCQKWEEKQDEREEMRQAARLEQAKLDAEIKAKQAKIAETNVELKSLKYYAIPAKGTTFEQLSLLPPIEKSNTVETLGFEQLEINHLLISDEDIEKE